MGHGVVLRFEKRRPVTAAKQSPGGYDNSQRREWRERGWRTYLPNDKDGAKGRLAHGKGLHRDFVVVGFAGAGLGLVIDLGAAFLDETVELLTLQVKVAVTLEQGFERSLFG